jgi:large subunit ribosomal protein L25
MSAPELNLHPRQAGKNYGKNTENVPAIVYGQGKEAQSVFLNEKEIKKLLSQFGSSRRITAFFNGEKKSVIIKEIQKDTLKNKLIHVDLQTLDENEKIKMTMPIFIVHRENVETSSEIVQVQLNEVEIQAFPRDLPERIEVNAELLKDKPNITLADLSITGNKKIEILSDLDSIVATMAYVTQHEEPTAEETETGAEAGSASEADKGGEE